MTAFTHDANDVIRYHYKFILQNGVTKEVEVKLDKRTLNLIQSEEKTGPQWAELKSFKCPNCPLEENQYRFCPIAINLVDLVNFFGSSLAYEEVDIVIDTKERGYTKHTSLQTGLSSVIGIYMVTSGCPIMEKLKPMVRHHLPFATLEETQYRVISMYILAQFLLHKRGKTPDWEFKDLVKTYDDIRIVNKNFCDKLTEIGIEDASINALVRLDVFADSVPFTITENMLGEIELLFSAYLD